MNDGSEREMQSNYTHLAESRGASDSADSVDPLEPVQISKDVDQEIDSELREALDWHIAHEEHHGRLTIHERSVYGAAMAIPQVARSGGWSLILIGLTLRVFLFLLVNLVLQFALVYWIYDELNSLNKYAGQPRLCNFGAEMWRCPDGPDCTGPGGTMFEPENLYDFQTWTTRRFVRDSLKLILPDKADEIDNHVNPGEYGVESYWCRLLCCVVFAFVVMDELYTALASVQLLCSIPTRAEPWVVWEERFGSEDARSSTSAGTDQRRMSDVSVATNPNSIAYRGSRPGMNRTMSEQTNFRSTSRLRYQVAGMSLFWKITNLAIVIVPQLLLFKCVAYIGICFLMETSSINDLIVNTTAMTFLLNIDELIYATFLSNSGRHICEQVARNHFKHDTVMVEALVGNRKATALVRMFPWRLFFDGLALYFLLCEYYHANCDRLDDGSQVSKKLYFSESIIYNPICIFVNCQAYHAPGDQLAYQMPLTT
jgi:hypothetical protein